MKFVSVLVLGALLVIPPVAGSAADSSEAAKSFKSAAKGVPGEAKATLKSALDSLDDGLASALEAHGDDGAAFLAAAVAALGSAHATARSAHGDAINDLTSAGRSALIDGGVSHTAATTVGAGDAIDKLYAKVVKEFAKFDAGVAKQLDKSLKQLRKGLSEDQVITGASFPVLLWRGPAPDVAVPFGSSFAPHGPLALLGYGDAFEQWIGIVAADTGTSNLVSNLYDAEGNLLQNAVPVPVIDAPRGIRGGAFDVTELPPEAHGNLRVEVFVLGKDGWTLPIGH